MRKNQNTNIAELLNGLPPEDAEAEAALLGSLILDGKTVGEVASSLSADSFYRPAHALIFQAIVDVAKNGPLDLVMLKSHLSTSGNLKSIGGIDYLVGLADQVPNAMSAPHYAKIVREKHQIRQLIQHCCDTLQSAYAGGRFDDLCESTVSSALELGKQSRSVEFFDEASLVQFTVEEIKERRERDHVSGYETGFGKLDSLIGGLEPGTLTILAARPSVGKSLMGGQWCEHFDRQGAKPMFISMEMSEFQLGIRRINHLTGYHSSRLRKGELTDNEIDALSNLPETLTVNQASYVVAPHCPVGRVISIINNKHSIGKVGAVFIDYLQIMQLPKGENRNIAIQETTNRLKGLAISLRIPIVLLSQLSRDVEKRGGKPRLSDLRDSGSIEQDADNVVFIHRPDFQDRREPASITGKEHCEMIVAKARDGQPGSVDMTFNGSALRFEEDRTVGSK